MEALKMICEIKWWPVSNDLVGGWIIIASETEPPKNRSEIKVTEQVSEVADLIHAFEIADHICRLHNSYLEFSRNFT